MTCLCSLVAAAPDAHARRRLTTNSDETGVTNVVAMLTYEGESFAGTFSAAGTMDSAEALRKVLIVLGMFIFLWVAGMLMVLGCILLKHKNKKHHTRTREHL